MSHTITLNGKIINILRPNIHFAALEKYKADREELKFADCLFLTQNKNVLTYQIATNSLIIRITDLTDQQIPYPLAINLYPLKHELSDSTVLEIPDCTFGVLQTRNDPQRPGYIKNSDLQTNVVKLGDDKTNLVYFEKIQYYTSMLDHSIKTMKPDIPENALNYGWDSDVLYKIARTLEFTNWTRNPFLYALSENEIHKEMTANKLLQNIHQFGYVYRKGIDKEYHSTKVAIPVAIFEKEINKHKITVLLTGAKTY